MSGNRCLVRLGSLILFILSLPFLVVLGIVSLFVAIIFLPLSICCPCCVCVKWVLQALLRVLKAPFRLLVRGMRGKKDDEDKEDKEEKQSDGETPLENGGQGGETVTPVVQGTEENKDEEAIVTPEVV